MNRIAVAWNGLPHYAARLLRAGIERVEEPVHVLGSRPSVPIEGMEEVLGQPIHWIDSETSQSWTELDVPVPDLFLHTGWRYPGFNSLGQGVREQGGRVVSMIDNRWKNTMRQWGGAVLFRFRYRRWFDAVWVPGASGHRLCRFLGMSDEDIYEGLYGADPKIFTEGPPLHEREKVLLFVGQLIPRKGIDLLLQAFRRFRSDHPDWRLQIIGEGKVDIPSSEPGLTRLGFLQPHDVGRKMRESRFLVLPSREDHWGLVVHEAALSGCGLLVSENVGAAPDLVTSENGVVYQAGSVKPLQEAMEKAAHAGDDWLYKAFRTSRSLGGNFGPDPWAATFVKIVRRYSGCGTSP